jgi:hypothetical protein
MKEKYSVDVKEKSLHKIGKYSSAKTDEYMFMADKHKKMMKKLMNECLFPVVSVEKMHCTPSPYIC